MLLKTEHCWTIVPDRRAALAKNEGRFKQKLDTSKEAKIFKKCAISQTIVLKFLKFICSVVEYLMVFPEPRSTENYAMKNPAIASNLSQLSVCFFIKLVADQGGQFVINYAIKEKDNSISVEMKRTLALVVNHNTFR